MSLPAGADTQCRGADCRVHADDGHEVEGGEEEELLEVGGGHAERHARLSQDDELVHAEDHEGEEHVDGEVASQPLRVVVEQLWEGGTSSSDGTGHKAYSERITMEMTLFLAFA